jgi:hypothetical protein
MQRTHFTSLHFTSLSVFLEDVPEVHLLRVLVTADVSSGLTPH